MGLGVCGGAMGERRAEKDGVKWRVEVGEGGGAGGRGERDGREGRAVAGGWILI